MCEHKFIFTQFNKREYTWMVAIVKYLAFQKILGYEARNNLKSFLWVVTALR